MEIVAVGVALAALLGMSLAGLALAHVAVALVYRVAAWLVTGAR